MIEFFKLLRAIQPLTPEFRDTLEDAIKEKRVKRKEFLLKVGHVCRNIYFVDQGILRRYYLKDDREISSAFAMENELCFCPASFFSQQPGIENIQAVEDSVVYSITFDDYARFCNNFPEFNLICRVLLERCYARRDQTWAELWMMPAEIKVDWFMKQTPELLLRVPAKYLASYLGMTESMFSMVRRR